jgi:hypothetical protein
MSPRPIFLRLRRSFPWRSALLVLATAAWIGLWLGLDLLHAPGVR